MSEFRVVTCNPDDALFDAALSNIYPDGIYPKKEIDEAHYRQGFVVMLGEEPYGGLVLYQNSSIGHNGKATALFGNFECRKDANASNDLIDAATKYSRSINAEFVIGPMNGSTWNQYRFITEHGELPSYFTEQNHPPYYPKLWLDAGFKVVHEYVSNLVPIQKSNSDSKAFLEKHDLTIRKVDADSLDEDLEEIYPLCQAAFSGSPFFSPIDREQFFNKLLLLKPVISKGFTRIVSDGNSKPVAFILCFPDVLDPNGKTLVLKTAAKSKEHDIPGLISALHQSIMEEAREVGFEQIIHAFMHVQNRSLIRSKEMNGSTIRKYSLFLKEC
jgi:hypothetical protein